MRIGSCGPGLCPGDTRKAKEILLNVSDPITVGSMNKSRIHRGHTCVRIAFAAQMHPLAYRAPIFF